MITRLIRWIDVFFRAIMPHLIVALDTAIWLMATTFTTLLANQAKTAQELADQMLLKARVEGPLEPFVWRGSYVISWVVFVLGWILLSQVTVWLFWWIFWKIL